MPAHRIGVDEHPMRHDRRYCDNRRSRFLQFAARTLLLFLLAALPACEVAEEPEYVRVLELKGTPYEQGVKHGEEFASEIQSLYTQLLDTAIMPYLNREQKDVMAFLTRYQEEEYQDGKFAYQMMYESANNLLQYMPQEYIDEMIGISDGSGVPLDEVLILNTAFDTMLSFRAIVFFIKAFQGPHVLIAEFVAPAIGADGIDNDGDWLIDEPHEAFIEPYEPKPYASMAEVPVDASLQFIMTDFPEGVDGEKIRIQMGDTIYTGKDNPDAIQTMPVNFNPEVLQVRFTPPGGFPPASVVSLILQASDLAVLNDPGPLRSRQMRDEWITFSTTGYGKQAWEIPNVGLDDGRTEPPPIAFAARRSATADGHTYLAQHFSLLDAGSAHKHTAVLIHHPQDGKTHVTIGWTGTVSGFSGMNEDGVAFSANTSDTLDNPMTGQFKKDRFEAQLLCYGMPIGMAGREILRTSDEIGAGVQFLKGQTATFGWNVLLADAAGAIAAIEMDTNITESEDGGFNMYTPEAGLDGNHDPWGRAWASVGIDDIRVASHYQKNYDDIHERYVVIFDVKPQRYWSSFYNRSLRAFYLLGERIDREYGALDADSIINIMRARDLADERDSMTASVFDTERRLVYYGLGEVPAVDAVFRKLDLKAYAGQEGD